MNIKSSVLLSLLASTVEAHFKINFPGQRNPNTGNAELSLPCGGNNITERYEWNPDGSPVGIYYNHNYGIGAMYYCGNGNCTTNDDFDELIYEPIDQTVGNFCIPSLQLPEKYNKVNNTGVIQIIYATQGDEVDEYDFMYNCIDIVVSKTGPTFDGQCSNSSSLIEYDSQGASFEDSNNNEQIDEISSISYLEMIRASTLANNALASASDMSGMNMGTATSIASSKTGSVSASGASASNAASSSASRAATSSSTGASASASVSSSTSEDIPTPVDTNTEAKITIQEPEKTDSARNRQFNGHTFKPQFKLYNDPLVSRFIPELENRRIVPSIPTYYCRNPYHEMHMNKLQDLLNKNVTLPFDRKKATASWLRFNQYKERAGGELLKETEYLQLVNILKRLDSIDVELRSDDLNNILSEYMRKQNANQSGRDLKTLDNKGRAIAVGRRKSSSAKIYVVEGNGQVLVNGKSLEEVFPKPQDRLKLLYPLQIIESAAKFNIFGLVRGGGSTGQIEALQLALAKSLCIHNPLYKQRLSSAGVLHRDPRSVERKKPGKKKARKMPTWVKR
ncbi:hypothetical protein C6P40_001631 [Pichia californica]|uniref:Small ribosomal subunit protein uS9m n=1 Tax=Pichia californica TaxID=460514 RepID=A0A9P6WQD8_9ASCO|nr:hypothetical protein C6P40_001631 [[Candida] californica]